MSAGGPVLDPFSARRALAATGALGEFNAAGVLSAADVHVAERLAALAGEADESVRLAAALAVRAPRLGHVYVDLTAVRQTVTVDSELPGELESLPWPAAESWTRRVAGSPLVAVGDGAGEPRPLRLLGSWLYLDRYWREERELAQALRELGLRPAPSVSEEVLRSGLERLLPEADAGQRLAAASAVRRTLCVLAGGPGTGKTTTVARTVALLCEQAAARGSRPPLVALAAPTGKAAARLEEAVHHEAAEMEVDESVRIQLMAFRGTTLHRLLGPRAPGGTRFGASRLPHDVVIVDESSMVSLSLMARLLGALRPSARLILVGDPAQLASIEAGAVLGDIVAPAVPAPGLSQTAPSRPARAGPPAPSWYWSESTGSGAASQR